MNTRQARIMHVNCVPEEFCCQYPSTHEGSSKVALRPPQAPVERFTAPGYGLSIALIDVRPQAHEELQEILDNSLEGATLQRCLCPADARQLSATRPKAILIDIDMPQFGGAAYIHKLHLLLPASTIIILARDAQAPIVLTSLMAGATGCLIKPVDRGEMINALLDASTGSYVLCGAAQQIVLQALRKGSSPIWDLSPQKQKIVGFLAQGMADKEIAEALGIEPGTVHVHVAAIFSALGVHRRSDVLKCLLGLALET